jgi:hypothetical protein
VCWEFAVGSSLEEQIEENQGNEHKNSYSFEEAKIFCLENSECSGFTGKNDYTGFELLGNSSKINSSNNGLTYFKKSCAGNKKSFKKIFIPV